MSESVSESSSCTLYFILFLIFIFLFFLLVFCCHSMLCNVSLRFVPTRHRVQQGDAHKRHSSKCVPGLKTQYTQVIKTKQSLFPNPRLTLSRYLLIEIRAKHDQPIDWVGLTQPPVQEKSGPKKRVGPYWRPQPPGSHPPPTRDAAHGKHAGSEGDRREQEELYKEELCCR